MATQVVESTEPVSETQRLRADIAEILEFVRESRETLALVKAAVADVKPRVDEILNNPMIRAMLG